MANITFGICPSCDGTDLDRDLNSVYIDRENRQITIEVECEDCGKTFEETYRFIKSEKL